MNNIGRVSGLPTPRWNNSRKKWSAILMRPSNIIYKTSRANIQKMRRRTLGFYLLLKTQREMWSTKSLLRLNCKEYMVSKAWDLLFRQSTNQKNSTLRRTFWKSEAKRLVSCITEPAISKNIIRVKKNGKRAKSWSYRKPSNVRALITTWRHSKSSNRASVRRKLWRTYLATNTRQIWILSRAFLPECGV